MIEPSPQPQERASSQASVEVAQTGGLATTGERLTHREQVEMMARFRRDITSTTVMLKDLTRFGARVEGVGALEVDEMVTLSLPGCRPSLAFVAWANEHCAGLEFVEPLAGPLFAELVARYGLSGEKLAT
ncbi:hypothetical protein [Novosphingobium sp. AP12]|uniref:hypothetical protein n=1 Tax=Novosphingobium sp. AP12 TaxID=1144305 RepID=UPI0002720B66|nr:hypothetical protein [Novosphingobium sp. AP12]EJL20987.1 hypothetical protein PMI02_05311 [Novosphingobium sp. AP12]